MWKFENFSLTHILREINCDKLKVSFLDNSENLRESKMSWIDILTTFVAIYLTQIYVSPKIVEMFAIIDII